MTLGNKHWVYLDSMLVERSLQCRREFSLDLSRPGSSGVIFHYGYGRRTRGVKRQWQKP